MIKIMFFGKEQARKIEGNELERLVDARVKELFPRSWENTQDEERRYMYKHVEQSAEQTVINWIDRMCHEAAVKAVKKAMGAIVDENGDIQQYLVRKVVKAVNLSQIIGRQQP